MNWLKTATIRSFAFSFVLLLSAAAAFGADGDGDGVIDSLDNCPATAAGEVVNASGCSVNDLCPCAGPAPAMPWNNHGEYVSCVTHALDDFADQGLIARSERGGIVSAAARSGCGHRGAENTEALTIQTFVDETAFPAGEGVLVFIDGAQVGVTGVGGIFTAELLPNREYRIRVLEVGLVGGRATIFLEPSAGGTQTLQIIMTSEAGVTEDARLVVEGVSDRILDAAFPQLGMRFEYPNGTVARLTTFDYLLLRSSRNEDASRDVTSFFDLDSEGRLVLTDVEAFRSSLLSLRIGEVSIEAYGEDAMGLIFAGQARFYVGRFSLNGLLLPPPSNPALATAGLDVQARFLQDAGIVYSTASDAGGAFTFNSLPAGNWEIAVSTADGALIYNGFATLSVVGDVGVRITLRTTVDILNNVPPYQITSFIQPQEAESGAPDRYAAQDAYSLPQSFVGPGRGTGVTVMVIAGSQDAAITDSESLTVPQGTEKVILTYNVASAEYPFYVLSQSIFNDVWTLVVVGSSGGQLFQITRQVNSMIFVPPFWQGDGTTGEISEELDVSGLTASGDVEIVLSASATNIGDSILPTWVVATLDFEPELRINEVNADTVTPTRGDSSYYSIPRSGETNTFTRMYTLKITRPDDSTISNVKATLRGGGNDLMTIVDEGPGMLVTEVDDETLEVLITMGADNPSTVNSTPPPAHNLVHRFMVEADVAGETVMDEKDSNPRRGLWMLPDGIARKGARDEGGDGWCSKGAYEWLENNGNLVPEVDDISGEHARDIGHSTHYRGTDIDTYHFTNLLTGALNGGANYRRFRDYTIQALGGDDEARDSVLQWIAASRAGLTALADLNTVAALIYHLGAAHDVLPGGWARSLIENGMITDTMGRTLDLELDAYSEEKVSYRNDHNDHLHIDLNDAALNNNP